MSTANPSYDDALRLVRQHEANDLDVFRNKLRALLDGYADTPGAVSRGPA
jgi:hypothetical protein